VKAVAAVKADRDVALIMFQKGECEFGAESAIGNGRPGMMCLLDR
jgi:hypothetical protein